MGVFGNGMSHSDITLIGRCVGAEFEQANIMQKMMTDMSLTESAVSGDPYHAVLRLYGVSGNKI